MPELPEVENVRQALIEKVKNQQIRKITSSYTRMILTGFEQLKTTLEGQKITDIRRRGKYLLFDFDNDYTLISHLRMEGKYRLENLDFKTQKHDHIFVELDEKVMIYADVRKFGTWELLKSDQVEKYFQDKKIGPEPTKKDFDEQVFYQTLKKSSKKIKPYLLEQTLVAGLGNIYVDEVLWRANVHPEQIANRLTKRQIAALHQTIIDVLQKDTELGGSSIRTYNALGKTGSAQTLHQVYGKEGQSCARCGQNILKIKVGGRGTHFCPHCQKKK
jgi:formamidopyrimidine-DNA glycosylase